MHVYVPMTMSELAAALRSGVVGADPVDGFAVTPGLREALADESDEELEYAAQVRAAAASLLRLVGDPGAPRRRVVVAVDVDESLVDDVDGLDTGAVVVRSAVPVDRVVSAHVDDVAATGVVARVVADPGDADAASDLDDHQLLWFAAQELDEVVAG